MTKDEAVVIDYIVSGYLDNYDITKNLSLQHFQSADARSIFSAVKQLQSREIFPIDFVQVQKIYKDFDIELVGNCYFAGMDIDKYVEILTAEKNRVEMKALLVAALKDIDSIGSEEIKKKILHKLSHSESGISIKDIYDSKRMYQSYKDYLASSDKNTLKLGIHNIDKHIKITPGEVLFIMGRPGTFKTALLQQILQQYSFYSQMGSCFFSLEMPVQNVAERFLISSNTNITKELLQHQIKEQDDSDIKFNFKLHMGNFFVVPKKCSLDQMPSYIRMIENKNNIKIGAIGIDYLKLVKTEFTKEYEHVGAVARGSKDLAKELNIPVVLLVQTSRKAAAGTSELELDYGRGSGEIEESCDALIGLWHNTDSNGIINKEQLICKILKNRKGKTGDCYCLHVNPETFVFNKDSELFTPPEKEKNKDNNL